MTRAPTDQHQRDQLIKEHLGFVRAVAAKVKKSLSPQLDFEELVAYGSKGLVEAAERFDPSRGVAFTTFSYYRIRGAIYDGLRQQGWLSRSQYGRFVAAANSYMENQAERGAGPAGTVKTEQTVEDLANTLDDLATIFLTSMSGEDGPEPADQSTPDGSRALEEKESSAAVQHAVRKLPAKERSLVERYYYGDTSLAQAGRDLGLSKSWASRLHARAIRLLSRELGHLAPSGSP
jgi:RNA polymerase sigma factor for flagellar operon FliA